MDMEGMNASMKQMGKDMKQMKKDLNQTFFSRGSSWTRSAQIFPWCHVLQRCHHSSSFSNKRKIFQRDALSKTWRGFIYLSFLVNRKIKAQPFPEAIRAANITHTLRTQASQCQPPLQVPRAHREIHGTMFMVGCPPPALLQSPPGGPWREGLGENYHRGEGVFFILELACGLEMTCMHIL